MPAQSQKTENRLRSKNRNADASEKAKKNKPSADSKKPYNDAAARAAVS
jgi:hypothetical protein